MTSDEFIDGYMQRSDIPASARTKDGFKLGDSERVAVPCDCGEDICDGWKMVSLAPPGMVCGATWHPWMTNEQMIKATQS